MVWTNLTPRRNWTPWNDLAGFRNEIEKLFDASRSSARGEGTPMNLWLGEEGAVLTAQLPGFRPEDLTIDLVEERLTLKGTRTDEPLGEDATVVRSERSPASFERSFTLPFRLDADGVTATLVDGLLELRLPKAASERPRQITVNAS